ncbi:MAG: hypothetical protein DKM50_14010 [Candidatus Margulisiibacteriota bacterium]|nr:MAG: hypothetical protein A2X43_01120 [Candidatus Margulisbacteria bacterium GWD2_39_127]OGI03321.1 MAG: hypothetical protein A2X42_06905 [Candidatus Margulisbacteria bacterium GWF2_38_17]OGI12005.1 MAG: hypothetical protein A2X41_02985 [Candidatus Margulisbacteria bacterium GWE2_39_32]PZM77048.1 MAG: hypothetical protein DKM50_14010 [Candidatus Margulisiibacteriota bacterium]HAR63181.1 hypothetical protein [Candidatus Margulisiibacteriota bacterium]
MADKKKSISKKNKIPKITQTEFTMLTADEPPSIKIYSRKKRIPVKLLITSLLTALVIIAFLSVPYLKSPLDLKSDNKKSYKTGIIIVDDTVVREGNGIEFPPIAKLKRAQTFVVLNSEDAKWIKVKLDEEHVGWLEKSKIIF